MNAQLAKDFEEIYQFVDEQVPNNLSEASIHLLSDCSTTTLTTPQPTLIPSPASSRPSSSTSITPRRSSRKFKILSNNQLPQSISVVQKSTKKIPLKHLTFLWKKSSTFDFGVHVPLQQQYFTDSISVLTPTEYFFKFFSEDLITLMVEQSNLYSFQKFQKLSKVLFML